MRDAAYCRMRPVTAVRQKVRRHRADIVAAVERGADNGCMESVNSKIKAIVRMGYGFRNTGGLAALLMLRCSDE